MTPDPSLDLMRGRLAQSPENELFRFSLGKALYDRGETAEAVSHFEVALTHKPDWMLVAILLGKCWRQLGDFVKARQYLELGRKLAHEQQHDGPLEEATALLSELGEA